ncbi:MAG: 4Fe-4S binding protein, partial [Proteobacteria bacterium]|nr:4Fe-4S binding protein [Pseudomonadota bacterium]
GHIAPSCIEEYVANGGYLQARRAYIEMTPQAVCDEVLASGLRGRGGGGFPTGRKWLSALIENGPKKYVVCNADEGDPGAFMDRSLMEGDPHRIIEGMMIAARAIGADEGYMYVRAEYPLAVERVRKAVADALEAGILGENLFGTGQGFVISIKEGAGAFVCGEETALLASIEGYRGMPKSKPPFPSQKGLFGCPTVINNVETLGAVPLILRDGAEKYRAIGTESSPGTKTFALTGHVQNTGLIEVPFGSTLRHIIYDIGEGVTDDAGHVTGEDFKAVQIGGPSGGCLVPDCLDMPLDFDSLRQKGAMVGSGGLVVMNNQTCMVQVARFFMQFTQNESCGKCVLCREGTKQMLQLMDQIIEGVATEETLLVLENLAHAVQKGSLCALGKTAPNPVLSVLKLFREEMLEHVVEKHCRTRKCKALSPYVIDPVACKRCGLCVKKCPVDAITGDRQTPYVIDGDACIRCGACKAACKFGAIEGA